MTAQVEPSPLDPPIAPIGGDTLAWALPELTAIASDLGVEVGWEPMAAGCDGSYRPSERRIAVSTRVAVNQQAAVTPNAT